MKYTISINVAGVSAAGLWGETDFEDWAIMDYIRDWQSHTKALRTEGNKVWIDYNHMLAEIPALKVKKAAISKRIANLRELKLLETVQDKKTSKLYAGLTELACDVMMFSAQDSSNTRFPQETPRFPQETPRFPQETPRFPQETNKYINNSLPITEEEKRESAQPEPAAEPEPVADATPSAKPALEKRATRLADDFELPAEWVTDALKIKPEWTDDHAIEIGMKFADHWRGVAGKAGRKLDWRATWRNWVRNERQAPRAAAAKRGGYELSDNFLANADIDWGRIERGEG